MAHRAIGRSARGARGNARAKSAGRDMEIIANGWTRAQCRAIELSLGGGFLAMAVLEAVFGW